jgi:hypothetical protein
MKKVLKRLKSNGLVTSTKDYHAKLVIHGLPRMESKDIKRLGEWLGSLSKWALEVAKSKKGKEYCQVFTNKLMK